MLFWIFIIIMIAACIILGLPNKAEQEYQKLQREADRLNSAWRYLSYDAPNYKEVLKASNKADKALREFKDTSKYKKVVFKETIDRWMQGTIIFCLCAITAMLIVLGCIYASAGGVRASLESERETLSWEIENDIYTDSGDDVVGKKELYNQVREWNANLAVDQYYEKNFWIGIFVPNIYGDLKPIELK